MEFVGDAAIAIWVVVVVLSSVAWWWLGEMANDGMISQDWTYPTRETSFLFKDKDSGIWISQRELPSLALSGTRIDINPQKVLIAGDNISSKVLAPGLKGRSVPLQP